MNTDQHAANAAAATASLLRPKNFFANERTFLSWLHAAILAGGLGLAILNFGTSTSAFLVPALVFTTISVAIMAYSLWQFWVRAERLSRQESGTYDDRFATVCILVILFVGIGLNLIIKLYSPAA
ncbi:vacuolar transporter chaperone [Dimargaris xerosporica]|nr:vacuolar transporter chaperone [Dimargaris xerosporica]